jgi:lipid II:glycine glycyltransferase (peptidoglycan interpeptide bridge formation enzyme)
MEPVFKSSLDSTEIESISKFCDSADYYSIEQSIGWMEIFYDANVCYFILYDENEIRSFCLITQSFRFAHIEFGPVCNEKELVIISINEIINYYKKKGFLSIDIQMYYKSGYDTEYIEYALNTEHRIKYSFNNSNTKSSIEIDLEKSIDDIYGKIRKGHKSDIKKAIKLGFTVDPVRSEDELASFFEIYAKMCKARNIEEGELSSVNMTKIYNYLVKNNKGVIFIVRDNDGIILGGAIFVYQGISVRYYKGASDPDKRDIPVTHIVLYEAIKKAKADNFRYFDFWGYNHFANENDQVYYINHFKKGFGGYYTFFAKKMNIDLFPFGCEIYKSMLFVRNLLRKVSFKNN